VVVEVVVQHTHHQQQPYQTVDVDRQTGLTINGVMMKTIMPNVIGMAELAVTITMLVGIPIAQIVNAQNLAAH
jgi:hypothetical protein